MRRVTLVAGWIALFATFEGCGGSAVSNSSGGGKAADAGSSSTATGGVLSGSGGGSTATAGKASTLPPKPMVGEEGGAPVITFTAGAPAVTAGEGGALGVGGETGSAGVAGEGGAVNCDSVTCTTQCPAGRWQGTDGCATCACAPPTARLSRDAFTCPAASLTLKTATSWFIGGVNRWLLDFTWSCDGGGIAVPGRATLQIGIVQPPQTPVDATNHTAYFGATGVLNDDDYELRGATTFLRGSGVPEISEPLATVSGFISLRREGNELVGGVQYVGQSATQSHITTLAGPFRVPVPEL